MTTRVKYDIMDYKTIYDRAQLEDVIHDQVLKYSKTLVPGSVLKRAWKIEGPLRNEHLVKHLADYCQPRMLKYEFVGLCVQFSLPTLFDHAEEKKREQGGI